MKGLSKDECKHCWNCIYKSMRTSCVHAHHLCAAVYHPTAHAHHLRAGFVLTVISCPDLSRFSRLCKSTSTPQLYTPSSGSETGSPDAVQTVEGDSTSASSLRSQLPVDPARENENEGESNLESYAVFFLVCCSPNSFWLFAFLLFFYGNVALVLEHPYWLVILPYGKLTFKIKTVRSIHSSISHN